MVSTGDKPMHSNLELTHEELLREKKGIEKSIREELEEKIREIPRAQLENQNYQKQKFNAKQKGIPDEHIQPRTYDDIVAAQVEIELPGRLSNEYKKRREEPLRNSHFTGGRRKRCPHKRTLRKHKRRTHKRNHRRTHRR